ncbi:hypothetical protein CRUP_034975 [Coryphaenoides rupestris]|nr:hypothetical protein CRUP_034975 [Coryphaenoides rupestris]
MPLSNKCVSGGGGPGQVCLPEQGEPPPAAEAMDQLGAARVVHSDLGDPGIVKSPSDPKKYRYIQLANGLQALLISELKDGEQVEESGAEADGEEEQQQEVEEEEDDDGDSGEGTEEEEEEAEEEADSDFEELDEEKEKEEGKSKKANSEKQSAAALCIGVGSFSDPEDLPGLAHFLEHMVFMGSEKYPAENGFDAFLKKHGGSDNASTDCERTIFQFDVQRKFFRQALDSLAKPGHPMGKFYWGNAQTLKHEPREKQINTYQRLRDFWKRYYSAHYMTLAVQSKDVPRVKPLHYISWLIGHEGKGSILSLLRKRCWALTLFGGNNETGFDQNSTYSIFSVSITLTDQGFQNVYQVVHLVFQYMKMLQTLGPQQRIYEEIQKIEANEFHYQEQMEPIMYVENICENMQLFPKEDFLTGDQLMFEYDPQVIGGALGLLTPARANLMLLSPEHEGLCLRREPWFTTSYSIEDITKEWAELWKGDFPLNSDLHLPEENKFIATDFELRASDCPDTEFPVRVSSSDRGCLWYKKDNKFKIPKAYVRFHLVSPVIQKSPKSLVLFDLFVNILAYNLAEPAYQAQMKKTYFNILINPVRLARDVRLLVLEPGRWSLVQKYQALVAGLTHQDLLLFSTELKEQLYTEGLVQGNLSCMESKQMLQYITTKLQFRPLAAEVAVVYRVAELPQQHHRCKIKTLNKGDANSDVTVYYQSGLRNLREHTLMELLVMHMEEPCFDFLRTKETLGYQVYPSCRNTSGVLGFSGKIEEFLACFGEKMASLSEEAFRTQVTALVKVKECEDSHLGEEVERHWFEVFTQQYLFQRLHKEIEALKLITREELVSCSGSIAVVGFGEKEGDPAEAAGGCGPQADAPSTYGEVSQLTFLPVSSPQTDATAMITDIRAFTSALPLHPYHKILH